LVEGNPIFTDDLKALKAAVPVSSKGSVAYDMAVVADRERKIKLYVGGPGNERSLVSTIFKENTVDSHVPKKLQAYDLDTILKRNDFLAPEVLKLDIQGAEYMALTGAPELLKHVKVILMEAITQPMYNSQQPALFQIYKKLFNENFEVFDISGVTQASDAFLQADIIFVRKSLKELWGINCTGFPIPKHFEKNE
jgi:FkbM family methyltransferase